jgi:gliding motility associated protien GldN
MNKIIIAGLVAVFAIAGGADAFSQRKKAPVKKKVTVVAPAVDTTTPTPPPPPPIPDTIPLKQPPQGRRPASTITGNIIQDKTPLQHDDIRIDDQVYKQVIWRIIDTREKMNLSFRYEANEDNGNQRFINILLKHIKDGDITAFDNGDDRFTTPLPVESVAKMLVKAPYTIQVADWVKDPTGATTKDTTIREEFNPDKIRSYTIKEEIVFDRETSRLHFRILGIAPMMTVFNDDETERATYRMFWIYYPDLRPYLSKYEAYNPRNMGARLSWEEIFESRYFASYIYKSTLNNPFDKPLEGMFKDPLMRLLEGERIKETIFNWEQDQWSY